MIAITFALPEESKDLRRKLQNARRAGATKAGPVWTGALAGADVVVCHTGVGTEAAGKETRALLARFAPEQLISSGFAGGLSRELQVGDVVFDARGGARTAPKGLTARCVAGSIVTEEQTIETPAEKEALAARTGALAVDMETAAIAEACAEAGLPIVGIRGISDAVTDHLPVPMEHWFDQEKQRPRPLALVWYLARNPSRIQPFIRFLSGLPVARAAMTAAVEAWVREIAAAKV